MSQNLPGTPPPPATRTGPLPGSAAPARRGRPLSVILAGASLVVSLAALGLAVQALNTANDRTTASPGPVSGDGVRTEPIDPVATTTTLGTTDSSTDAMPSTEDGTPSSEDGTPSSEDGTPTLPPVTASYTLSYQDQQLRLRPNNGCGNRSVDLDQPAVNVANEQSDVEYMPACGEQTPDLRFVSDKVATVTSAKATPNECAQAIQLAPSSQDIKPSQDLVICEVTNGVGAPNEPSRAKMVRIVVTGVSRDQTVNLSVTAWEVPH